MSQTQQTKNEDVPTVDLEPIGGGKVTVEEATSAAETIWSIFKGSDKEEPAEPAAPETGKGSEIGQTLMTYALYGVTGAAAVYLVGKALE